MAVAHPTTESVSQSRRRSRIEGLGGSVVKNLPAMQEMWVQPLGWEDTLEKRMETHSSILIWRIPWTEDLSSLRPMRSQTVGQVLVTTPPPNQGQNV